MILTKAKGGGAKPIFQFLNFLPLFNIKEALFDITFIFERERERD